MKKYLIRFMKKGWDEKFSTFAEITKVVPAEVTIDHVLFIISRDHPRWRIKADQLLVSRVEL